MSPLSRRQLLALGAVGAGAAAVGGAGLWWTAAGPAGLGRGADGGALPEPEVLAGSEGVLEVELTAAPARIDLGGRRADVLAFNGTLPGPTLRLAPGDTLRVRLMNRLAEPTNLHVHGLHVSPEGTGDDPFRSIAPGESFDYEFALPPDHLPGTYWYHPHHHGFVADQVAAGLYGAIVVEDPEPLPVTRERVLIVSDLGLTAAGELAPVGRRERMRGREGDQVLVNGRMRPRLAAAPGQRERWRVLNACPSRYLRLQLVDQQFRLLGHGHGRLPVPVATTEELLVPGARVDLLVETAEGTASLVAAPVDRGATGPMMGRGGSVGNDAPVELLTLAVSGDRVDAPARVPDGPVPRDLRGAPLTGRRTLDLGMGDGMGGGGSMMAFTIDGRRFDGERTDTEVAAGTVEEWTLTNSSPMDHPFHLHVWPMQVIEDGGAEVADPLWLDVVNVPAGGRVVVLVAFDDFTGRTVYHCHILDHEDLGMMGTLESR
jgi:FtsP/CotA-like multicopper oxidase with cupredoxin domain